MRIKIGSEIKIFRLSHPSIKTQLYSWFRNYLHFIKITKLGNIILRNYLNHPLLYYTFSV